VRIELSRDGGTHWSTLADHVLADRWTWIASGPAATQARLRVCDATSTGRADASARFAVHDAFGAAMTSAAAGGAFDAADLDRDGAPDAVLADAAGVRVLRGDGAGAFATIATWPEAGVRRVRIADIDADGALDVLTLHADRLLVRRGDGAGGFGAATTILLEPGSADFVIGDFDENGRPDLAVASGDGIANRVSIRLGMAAAPDGTPQFAGPVYTALSAIPTALVSADLDGDGVLDLVTAHASGIAVLRGGGTGGRGDGSFHVVTNRSFGMGDVRALHVADVDGDGRLDIVAADSAAGAVLACAGDGACGLAAPVRFACSSAPLDVALADLDRDGSLDAMASLSSGGLALMRGVVGAAFGARLAPATTLAFGGAGGPLALLDETRDGIADAIVAGSDGTLRVARGAMSISGAPRLLGSLPPAVATGTELALTWSCPNGVTGVDVELSRDGGAHWSAIGRSLPATSWHWSVSGPYTAIARLRVRDASVASAADSASTPFAIDPAYTGVGAPAPGVLALGSPWPNPAAGSTVIELSLPAAVRVEAVVVDVAGRHVASLLDAAMPAGEHSLRWSGIDAFGRRAPAGLYFVRVRAGAFEAVRRVVRL
jgi:hypothetical protein